MARWLIAHRQVPGDPPELERRLRNELPDLLGRAPEPIEADGTFHADIDGSVAGIPAHKRARIQPGVAARRGARLRIPVSWHADPAAGVFPRFDGAIELEPLSRSHARLTVVGCAHAPLGPVGAAVDAVGLHRVAERTVDRVAERIATGLRAGAPRDVAEPSHEPGRLRVADVMTPDPIVLDEDVRLRTAALVLFHHGVGGAPVVAADGELVGVLSESDLVDKEALPPHGLGRDVAEAARRARARTAGEACSRPARVTVPGASLREAAVSLREVSRLVVVDDAEIVGIVTRHDVLRALIRSDGELAAAVREAITAALGASEAGEVRVDVDWGVARLEGRVPGRSDVERCVGAAWTVDGIVGVEEVLDWDVDDEPLPTPLV